MARRIAAAGAVRVPHLAEGLREKWEQIAEGHLDLGAPDYLRAIDHGEQVTLDGGQVWAGLWQINPDEAERFRRSCGWRPASAAAWETVDATRWTFDPRASTLTPQ